MVVVDSRHWLNHTRIHAWPINRRRLDRAFHLLTAAACPHASTNVERQPEQRPFVARS
jgi:hypothetical protein